MDNSAAQKSETAKREEEVLAFWREHKTFEKSLEKDAPKGEFVFYDGPPFATGLPHHGSLLSSIIKDVVPRYKTMRGYRVRRRWGWDTHGLPIESLVEKELGLKTKKDIETIGVATFNEKARAMVLQFVTEWEKYVERVGRWVDFKNSYKTMDNTYIESVWWALKELWKKDLLYEGKKVLMYCPHCETPLAKAEIAMDNTYKDITEEAVTVRFKIKRPSQYGLPDNTSLLAWTTTPWTLPGNVALAVGPNISYVLAPDESGMVIVAKDRLSILEKAARPKVTVDMGKEYKGSELVGMEYEPLFDVPAIIAHPKRHVVLPADFVSTEEGTGIVHTAVMYGEDDFTLGQKEELPMIQLLNPNGTYNNEAPEFLRGKYIKDAEKEIKRDLESRGLLFEKSNHTHSYPHCYRCGTPLIYNAVTSWFINIQKVKAKMLSENEKVNWVPDHLKHGRFGHIVESAPDWTISRNRFWASPLPIWKEKGGSGVMVIDSVEEIKQRAKKSGNRYFVMRHGEARGSVEGFMNSDNSIENHLTEQGKRAVAEAAEKIKGIGIDLVIFSPLTRTSETAHIVQNTLGLPDSVLITDERLREVGVGEYNGKPVEEWTRTFSSFADRFTQAPRGGENYTELRRRVGAALFDLEKTYAGKKILIITHGSPSYLLQAVARGTSNKEVAVLRESEMLSLAEIRELPFAPIPVNGDYELDLHRPYTDDIILLDEKGREYERIKEVVDCWVESGSMPFAEYHYPFENKREFEKRAPGDFIAEYIAQTRTWFYYMHAMGILLFDRLAFRNVVSTGTILAADGEKISKSKRNYTDPLELIDRFGTDALRFYLMSSPVMQSEDVRFRDEDVRDAHNRFIGTLWNSYKFFELYKDAYDGKTKAGASSHVLDEWMLARLRETVEEVTKSFDAYDTPSVCRRLRECVEDYSTWYVRRSRERVKGGEAKDKQYTLAVQREVLLTLVKLAAPITPFIAESVYRGIGGGLESVHLDLWPKAQRGFFDRFFKKDEKALEGMGVARKVVSRALEARDTAGIKVRQPLSLLEVKVALSEDLLEVIRDEVNVKKVTVNASLESDVRLDTNLTPELKEEGFVRDLVRATQAARREAGLTVSDKAATTFRTSKAAQEIILKYKDTLQTATKSESISVTDGDENAEAIGEHTVAISVVRQ